MNVWRTGPQWPSDDDSSDENENELNNELVTSEHYLQQYLKNAKRHSTISPQRNAGSDKLLKTRGFFKSELPSFISNNRNNTAKTPNKLLTVSPASPSLKSMNNNNTNVSNISNNINKTNKKQNQKKKQTQHTPVSSISMIHHHHKQTHHYNTDQRTLATPKITAAIASPTRLYIPNTHFFFALFFYVLSFFFNCAIYIWGVWVSFFAKKWVRKNAFYKATNCSKDMHLLL